MVLLYITFIDFGKMESGSSVRPHKMYEAFSSLGIEIKLLEGKQNNRRLRKQRIREIDRWLDSNQPDFCYIEPPSGPMFNYADLRLIKKIHQKGIPIGFFYRDMFWKFPQIWNIAWWKKIILIVMHKRDIRYIAKYCNVVYFANTSALQYFPKIKFQKVSFLPPGGEGKALDYCGKEINTSIFVGGTTEAYGAKKLIQAFELLNAESFVSKLIIVTSKENLKLLQGLNFENYSWLKIVHTFDRRELEKLYSEARLAIIPFKKQIYMDLASPIKLFEYLGYGIPVVSTNCREIEKVINKYNCGIICEDSAEAIAENVEAFFTDEKMMKKLTENAIEAGKSNTWKMRAQKVVDDLTNIDN